jgi:hypothetical protein
MEFRASDIHAGEIVVLFSLSFSHYLFYRIFGGAGYHQ